MTSLDLVREAMLQHLASLWCDGNRHEGYLGNCPVCMVRYNALREFISTEFPRAVGKPELSTGECVAGLTASDVATAVEAHIIERTKAGKQPSKSEQAWMRSWPELVANGDPHPWYGPCDGLGSRSGDCSECERRIG